MMSSKPSCRKGLVMIVVYMLDVLRSCLIYPIRMQLQHLSLISQFQSLSSTMNRYYTVFHCDSFSLLLSAWAKHSLIILQIRDLLLESGGDLPKTGIRLPDCFVELVQEKVENPLDFCRILKVAFQNRGSNTSKFNATHLYDQYFVSNDKYCIAFVSLFSFCCFCFCLAYFGIVISCIILLAGAVHDVLCIMSCM